MNALENKSRPDRKPFFHFWRVFWLSFLVLSLAYAWHCFYVPSNEITWVESYDVAQTQAAENNKPMILYFSGKWCSPCRIMKREVWANDEVAETVNAEYVPVMIDVGDPNSANLLKQYGVNAAPITIITDSNGNVLRQRNGGMRREDFLRFLGNLNGPEARLAEMN